MSGVTHALRFNLACKAGHRYWTPTPGAWQGRDCGFQTGPTSRSRHRCHAPLQIARRGS